MRHGRAHHEPGHALHQQAIQQQRAEIGRAGNGQRFALQPRGRQQAGRGGGAQHGHVDGRVRGVRRGLPLLDEDHAQRIGCRRGQAQGHAQPVFGRRIRACGHGQPRARHHEDAGGRQHQRHEVDDRDPLAEHRPGQPRQKERLAVGQDGAQARPHHAYAFVPPVQVQRQRGAGQAGVQQGLARHAPAQAAPHGKAGQPQAAQQHAVKAHGAGAHAAESHGHAGQAQDQPAHGQQRQVACLAVHAPGPVTLAGRRHCAAGIRAGVPSRPRSPRPAGAPPGAGPCRCPPQTRPR